MEVLIVFILPIYYFLIRNERRVTRLETKMDFIYKKNGGYGK